MKGDVVMKNKTKSEITADLRNLRRLCKTPEGKESDLYKQYIELFNKALDEYERLIMRKCYIEGKSYYLCSLQISNCSEKTIYRAVKGSISKMEDYLKEERVL